MSYSASRRHKLRCFLLCREVSLKLEEKSRSGSGFTPIWLLVLLVRGLSEPAPHVLDHPGGLRVRVLPLLSLGVRKAESPQGCISLLKRTSTALTSSLSLLIPNKRGDSCIFEPQASLGKWSALVHPLHFPLQYYQAARATPASKCLPFLTLCCCSFSRRKCWSAGLPWWGLRGTRGRNSLGKWV